MMLIFSAGYFFIKLRFFLASIAGWVTLFIYNIGAIYYAQTPIILLINNNFFFVSANIIGMFAAYNIEYYARRNFFLNYELDNEKLQIEEINKNLEETVALRTKELQRAKERAEESDRLKSAFLANMSHEIRTPMNGILGFAEILKEPDLTSDQQQEYLGIIEKSGIRMLNIINDIVDISKIEAGLVKLKISESNINEQIEYIYTFFKPEVEANGMKLSFRNSLPIQESVIYTDREKTYAILTNLVKNAIKYSHKGAIEFGYSKKGEFLEFYVKDNGIGIPKDRQNAIFERFIQADIADLQARQGAGLGLSITKAYVEMLGGKIWVESEQGIGSTFYFTLPYNTRPENRAIQNDLTSIDLENVISPQVLQLKVLIAEDDEASERLLGIEVRKLSKEIIRVRTGLEAVVVFRDNPDIDLILMDIQMPGMDGYEATRQIRQINKDVVIIAQTAFGLSGDREKAIEAGCTDYISKPIKNVELQKLIQKYFKK
jgi:signal transduction histidine kinase